MSHSPSSSRLRRRLAVAAPLAAAVALAVTACAPPFIDTMDSPTPSGSKMPEPAAMETSDPSSAAPTSTADANAGTGSEASFPRADSVTAFPVKSISVSGTTIKLGPISSLTVDGDPTTDKGATITATGQCDLPVFNVKASGDNFVGKKVSSQASNCTEAEETAAAEAVNKVLGSTFSVTDKDGASTVTAGSNSLVLNNK